MPTSRTCVAYTSGGAAATASPTRRRWCGASSSSAQQIPKAADVVELGDFLKRVKCVPTASDVEKLLTDEELLETASSLMRRATALGLNVPKEAAKTMIERWLFAEKAYQVVQEAGLMRTKATLQMLNVHLNLRDAVPLAQPATAPLTSGQPHIVLPLSLAGASAPVVQQGGGGGAGVKRKAGEQDAEADTAAAKATKEAAKAKAAEKKVEKRRAARRAKAEANGTARLYLRNFRAKPKK